jgi:hypothetical protein
VYTGDGLTGRLWNTTSCLTVAPLTHSLVATTGLVHGTHQQHRVRRAHQQSKQRP